MLSGAMENTHYYKVVLKNADKVNSSKLDELKQSALHDGIEEFSIDEPIVDEILGSRAYSGGDVPQSVVDEIDFKSSGNSIAFYIYEGEIDKRKSKLESFLNDLSAVIEVEKHECKDWNDEWKKSYQEIVVTDDLKVVPALDFQKNSKKEEIAIYPGQGFGTGTHETTFLCLKAYKENLDFKPKNVLDMGCGSGILGIAAAKQDGSRVVFVDVDEGALENTEQNIDLNFGQEENLTVLDRKIFQENPSYDLVFANILQNILHAESEIILGSIKEGGMLILSGLLKDQEEETLKFYLEKDSTLSHVETHEKGDWVAVVLKKK